jgi:hypothetical protein
VVGQVHSWKLKGVVITHSLAFSVSRRLKFSYKSILPCTAFPSTLVSMLEFSAPLHVLLLLRVGGLSHLNRYLEVTVQEKLRSGWGLLWCHSFAFSASRCLSTLVSMLELSPPLPVLLLLRVGGLSRLNGYLEVTVQEKLRSGWPGPFLSVEGCCD